MTDKAPNIWDKQGTKCPYCDSAVEGHPCFLQALAEIDALRAELAAETHRRENAEVLRDGHNEQRHDVILKLLAAHKVVEAARNEVRVNQTILRHGNATKSLINLERELAAYDKEQGNG